MPIRYRHTCVAVCQQHTIPRWVQTKQEGKAGAGVCLSLMTSGTRGDEIIVAQPVQCFSRPVAIVLLYSVIIIQSVSILWLGLFDFDKK